MGLDAYELLLEVEDSFGITIANDDAAQVRTVGDLHELIALTQGKTANNVCVSAATFRLIRRVANTELKLDCPRLRPRDSVDTVIPRALRRQLWRQLQTALEVELPRLVRPAWITRFGVLVSVLTGITCAYVMMQSMTVGEALLAVLAVSAIAGVVFAGITVPFATRPDVSFTSFRGLTNTVLANNYAALGIRFNGSNTSDIWNALCVIIVHQLGVKPELVSPEARFVEDLGMD
jgi:acyl carrier protein